MTKPKTLDKLDVLEGDLSSVLRGYHHRAKTPFAPRPKEGDRLAPLARKWVNQVALAIAQRSNSLRAVAGKPETEWWPRRDRLTHLMEILKYAHNFLRACVLLDEAYRLHARGELKQSFVHKVEMAVWCVL